MQYSKTTDWIKPFKKAVTAFVDRTVKRIRKESIKQFYSQMKQITESGNSRKYCDI